MFSCLQFLQFFFLLISVLVYEKWLCRKNRIVFYFFWFNHFLEAGYCRNGEKISLVFGGTEGKKKCFWDFLTFSENPVFILRWLILIVFVPDKYFSIVPLCFWNKVVQSRAILLAKLQSRKIEDFSVKSVHYILRLLLPTIERR